MIKIIFASAALFIFSNFAKAEEAPHHLKAVNVEVAKAAFESYNEGHYRFIQSGKLIEAFEVDQSVPSCMIEGGKMTFNSEAAYLLESTRSLDVPDDTGEIELGFETQSDDPEAYFQIYCFLDRPGTSLETAREGLKSVFEID